MEGILLYFLIFGSGVCIDCGVVLIFGVWFVVLANLCGGHVIFRCAPDHVRFGLDYYLWDEEGSLMRHLWGWIRGG